LYERKMNLDLECDAEGYYLDQEDILLDVYRKAQSYRSKPTTNNQTRHYRAAGRILAWLGLATLDKFSEFGHKPSRLLLRLKYDPSKRLKSSQLNATCEEADAIELIFDAVFGEGKCDEALKSFACNVLGGFGLVKFTKCGEAIPTSELRAMAGYRRDKERRFREAQRCRRERKNKPRKS
jgi:hypothetical protein